MKLNCIILYIKKSLFAYKIFITLSASIVIGYKKEYFKLKNYSYWPFSKQVMSYELTLECFRVIHIIKLIWVLWKHVGEKVILRSVYFAHVSIFVVGSVNVKKAENKWSVWHDNNDLENIRNCVKVLEGSKKVKTVAM